MVKQNNKSVAAEVGLQTKVFQQKKYAMKQQHNNILDSDIMYLSDEIETNETLDDKQVKLLGEKLLGYQKDYFQVEDEDAEGQAPAPKAKKEKSAATQVQPLDFTLIDTSDLYRDEDEFYLMD